MDDEKGDPIMEDQHTERSSGDRAFDKRELWMWAATVFTFPIAGLAARAVIGPIDVTWEAVLAGAVAGAVIGTGQWLALRGIGVDARWIAATASGFAIGLGIAIALFGYGSTVGDMAPVGACCGLGIGIAQWFLLRHLVGASWVWIPATALFWALGWTVTTAIGVDAELRWAVFGLSGAATVVLISGGLLWALARGARSTASPS